jgi:hypothetical protein
MNNKFVKKVLILASLVAQAALSNVAHPAAFRSVNSAEVGITDRYTLPPSKVYIEPCHREVLLLHPGAIEKQQMLHRHGDFWARYEIQARDASEWFALCDLATGRVIREHKLIDDVF